MHILEDFIHHFFHYLLLGIVLLMGLGLFVSLPFEHSLRYLIVLLLSVGYVFWGVWHHLSLHKAIHLSVVIEYVLIASFGALIARGMLEF